MENKDIKESIDFYNEAKTPNTVFEEFEIRETTLLDYIKSQRFNDFQYEMTLDKEFEDFGCVLGNEFDGLYQLRDVFLLQKWFYDTTGVYLIFPIAGKFAHDKATDMDCVWCGFDYEGFDKYLSDLINKYEESLRNGE